VSDGLGPGAYLAGSVSFLALLAVLAGGAWRLRIALLPHWSGPWARLAEAIIAIAAVMAVAQVLGTFGAFSRGWLAAGSLLVSISMGAAGGMIRVSSLGTRLAASANNEEAPSDWPAPKSRLQLFGVVGGAGLVAAQWATHIADAYSRGMTHPDTLWYHASYAGYLLQTHDFTGLPDRTDVIQAYYPLNATVVHALVDLPFRADIVSPLVNIGWAVLALLAAFCIGTRARAGQLAVLGTLVVLGLPMLGGTQPGQASNDVAVGALLLASVGVLLRGRLAVAPTTLAGVAAGLAIGTKLTALGPVAALSLGVVVLAIRARRPAPALGWCATLLVFGSYWYMRNWIIVHNPLPWFDLELGPLSLPKTVSEQGGSLVDNFTNGELWRELYFPGLSNALGRVWPVVIAAMLAIAVLLLVRRRAGLERVVGAVILVGFVTYSLTPSSGGPNFAFNLRYLSPVLFLAFAALPLGITGMHDSWRRGAWILLLGLVILNATVQHHERIEAWPSEYVLVAVLTGIGVIVAAVLLVRWRDYLVRQRVIMVTSAVAVAVIVAVGWPVQRHFLRHRYVDANLPIDGIDTALRDVHDSDVIVFGTVETYPMLGLDLSNRVVVGQGPSTDPDRDPCRQWADVREGHYRYVVLTQLGALIRVSPPEDWFADDPAATELVRKGNNALYRIDGPLHPPTCARS
jgi:hypothetical protein